MAEAVIVSAVRLPTGKFLGTLKDIPAPALGAMVVREAVTRAGIDPATVDECIMGHVVSAGAGQAPARQAVPGAGLPLSITCTTASRVCGSGDTLRAKDIAARGWIRGSAAHAQEPGNSTQRSSSPVWFGRARAGTCLVYDRPGDGDAQAAGPSGLAGRGCGPLGSQRGRRCGCHGLRAGSGAAGGSGQRERWGLRAWSSDWSLGARIVVTLLHALEERGLRRGIASICIGGGEALSIAIERD